MMPYRYYACLDNLASERAFEPVAKRRLVLQTKDALDGFAAASPQLNRKSPHSFSRHTACLLSVVFRLRRALALGPNLASDDPTIQCGMPERGRSDLQVCCTTRGSRKAGTVT